VALTKVDIVEKVTEQLNFSKKESTDLVESFITLIKQTLASGEDVKISGFGSFEVKQKRDRKGRNPQTGETITIESRRIISFKTSAKLKAAINDAHS
jgi:integration host factor subunit alpha